MRFSAASLIGLTLSLSLGACATPDHTAGEEVDLLAEPRGGESLGETIARESRGDGCLVAGNAGRNRSSGLPGFDNPCRELREVIAPPQLPEGVEIITRPPRPQQPENG